MTPAEMKALCATEIEQLLSDFEKQHDRNTFFDLGAAAEVLTLCGGIESTKSLRERLSAAALGWLRSGLLDDAMFANAENLYHTSLFCYFASQAPAFHRDDAAYTERLLAGGLAGRNELPVISLQLIATCLSTIGIGLGTQNMVTRDLRTVLDRRVLRARSDEYDILTLTMVAQIFKLGGHGAEQLPRLFPRTVLVQAIRMNHLNWVAVLTLLCTAVYGMPEWLREGATELLASHLEQARGLLPPPEGRFAENEHVQRAERGLRVRSSIASFALLHE
ncbi:hypothetical protein ACLESD_10145 [Pyxidicoccus sp. 3LFB2]